MTNNNMFTNYYAHVASHSYTLSWDITLLWLFFNINSFKLDKPRNRILFLMYYGMKIKRETWLEYKYLMRTKSKKKIEIQLIGELRGFNWIFALSENLLTWICNILCINIASLKTITIRKTKVNINLINKNV